MVLVSVMSVIIINLLTLLLCTPDSETLYKLSQPNDNLNTVVWMGMKMTVYTTPPYLMAAFMSLR